MDAFTLRGGLSENVLKSEFKPWKIQFMEEFIEINVDTAAGSNPVGAAVRHLHAFILHDLWPPWMQESFLQAVPGDATVSRYSSHHADPYRDDHARIRSCVFVCVRYQFLIFSGAWEAQNTQ